jgi:predicted PurR-regulated permease PerM
MLFVQTLLFAKVTFAGDLIGSRSIKFVARKMVKIDKYLNKALYDVLQQGFSEVHKEVKNGLKAVILTCLKTYFLCFFMFLQKKKGS